MNDVESQQHAAPPLDDNTTTDDAPARKWNWKQFFFPKHSFKEAAASAWLPTYALLVFRLAVTAFLVGELTFFSLRGDYDYRYFAVWANLGFTVSMLTLTLASLIELINPSSLLEEPSDTGIVRYVPQVVIPLFQVFASVVVYVMFEYWAFEHPVRPTPPVYAQYALRIVNPVFAIADMFMSLMMSFRLVYILLVWGFELVYLIFFWVRSGNAGKSIYQFMEAKNASAGQVAIIYVKVILPAIILAFAMYGLSLLSRLDAVRRRAEKTHAPRPSPKDDDEEVGRTDDRDGSLDTSREASTADGSHDGRVPAAEGHGTLLAEEVRPEGARALANNVRKFEVLPNEQSDSVETSSSRNSKPEDTSNPRNIGDDEDSSFGITPVMTHPQSTSNNSALHSSNTDAAVELRPDVLPETPREHGARAFIWQNMLDKRRQKKNDQGTEASEVRESDYGVAAEPEESNHADDSTESQDIQISPISEGRFPSQRTGSTRSLSRDSRVLSSKIERSLSNLVSSATSHAESIVRGEEHCDNNGPILKWNMSRQDSTSRWDELDTINTHAEREKFRMPDLDAERAKVERETNKSN